MSSSILSVVSSVTGLKVTSSMPLTSTTLRSNVSVDSYDGPVMRMVISVDPAATKVMRPPLEIVATETSLL